MTDMNLHTLTDHNRSTPFLFIWSARVLPIATGMQFLLAGQALFGSMSWAAHGVVGVVVGLPVLILAGLSLGVPSLRGFAWWVGGILALYVLQIALAASGPSALAFHPFNAALLLTATLVLLAKVERRRSRHR